MTYVRNRRTRLKSISQPTNEPSQKPYMTARDVDIEALARELERTAITLRELNRTREHAVRNANKLLERAKKTEPEQEGNRNPPPRQGTPTPTETPCNGPDIPDYAKGERVYYTHKTRSKRGKGLKYPLESNATGTVIKQTALYIEIDLDNFNDAGEYIVD